MRSTHFLVLSIAAGACVAPPADLENASAVSIENWSREEIILPPHFAPDLPAGEELLLLAPGMFDREAEDFWSYVFLMRVAEAPLPETRLVEIFELYYDGLLEVVGEDRNESLGPDFAQVTSESMGGGTYRLEVLLVDTFVTMEPIVLHVRVEILEGGDAGSILRVKASPQAKGHPIWDQLEVALGSLSFPHGGEGAMRAR